MCGLAGIFDIAAATGDADLRRNAQAMGATLRHRGPDDDDVWVDASAGIALAHRRLAIIDISDKGRQPMHSACGRYVLVYNGEIYNHKELRRQLEESGRRFKSNSDTEALLESFAEWGIEATLKRAIGMFAFALWDRERKQLFIGRDRFGIKPIFWSQANGRLLFASELKALAVHDGFDARLDRNALASYLRFGYIPAPGSIYEGVEKVPPGCLLRIDAKGKVEHSLYWDTREIARKASAEPFRGDESEATDRLETLLLEAVRCRLEADVPLGAFLSGGIDSATVVSLMQRQLGRPAETFTIGFADSPNDERLPAKAIAKHLGSQHTDMAMTPDHVASLVPTMAQMADEPFGDSSQIPTYLVSKLAREQVTVSLSGDGGDELFCGYQRYQTAQKLRRNFAKIPWPLRAAGAAAIGALPVAPLNAVGRLLPGSLISDDLGIQLQRVSGALGLRDAADIYKRFLSHNPSPETLLVAGQERETILDDPGFAAEFPEYELRMQVWDTLLYLPNDILTKVDQASMAVSLEARVPLLDHRVAEFAWSLPLPYRKRGNVGKRLLRNVLSRYLPDELIDKSKTGFTPPIDRWLRGPLRDWADDLLAPNSLRQDGYLNADTVTKIWREHRSGHGDHKYALWVVLMFQSWLRS